MRDLTHLASIAPLLRQTVAVVGFGSQGQSFSENLRDSGVRVLVIQRTGSPRFDAANRLGFPVSGMAAAVGTADVLILALPDDVAPAAFEDSLRPCLRAGQTLAFLHGFNVHYGRIQPPPNIDVVLVAPKGQGRGVRSEFVAGRGVPALVAVAQDASGSALATALACAAGIGAHRSLILETTFADETETDLFGEQAVLCGGVSELIKAGFETLIHAGYPPELAYFECCHELKLVVDLIYQEGLSGMRARISSTARYGDLTRGPRVIGPETRAAMKQILDEVRSGEFAREFIAAAAAGGSTSAQLVASEQQTPLEIIGRQLRAAMIGPRQSDAGDDSPPGGTPANS